MTTGRHREGHMEGRGEDGGQECRKFSTGRIMVGVCAVGEKTEKAEMGVQCMWEPVSDFFFFLSGERETQKGNCLPWGSCSWHTISSSVRLELVVIKGRV